MAYLVLARKYRPKTFPEVVGQDVVKDTLKGALSEGRIGHAYLLSGPRGTGKTTMARLFAKALNCEQGPTPEPCGTCERCKAADAGREGDLIEIDAASNTGVDDVRSLRDQAAYAPLRARFKVYLIDEVHMLSKAAFNALLKTLEEPPPHVKFLLATTEPHKLLDTIVSRCQVLKLGPLPEERIAARLDEVFEREGIQAEDGVSAEIAGRARGGMRDALSMADQLLSLVGNAPGRADCARLASDSSAEAAGRVVEALLANDPAALLASLPRSEGNETVFLSGLLDHLRAALLLNLAGPDAPMLDGLALMGASAQEVLERGKRVGRKRLELWLQELLHAREQMRLLPAHGRLALEVTLLDLCRPEASIGLHELTQRLAALEARLAQGDYVLPAAPTASVASSAAPQPQPQPSAGQPEAAAQAQPAPAAAPEGPRVTTNSTADAWTGLLEELAQKSPSLARVLERSGALIQYQSGRAVIELRRLNTGDAEMIHERRNQKTITNAFQHAVGKPIEVRIQDSGQATPGADDGLTSRVKDLFDGRILEN